MFRTTRQLFFILAITIISSLAAVPLVSFVRDLRSYSDLEAPGVAFVLTPDHGTAAIFFGNGSSVAVARVEGTQAYKDLMLRHNTTLTATENLSNLKKPVSQLCSLKERFREQPKTMEDIDRSAVEPVLRGLKAAVEAYLGNSICFVKVALSPIEMSKGYLADIVGGAVRQTGLVEVWAGRLTAPVFALLSKWSDEGDYGRPESVVLVIDKSEYGSQLALIYQEDGLADVFRHNYHLYTATENATAKASSLQQALEDIIKPPFDYEFYGAQVPQQIKDLVIYGDDIWNPDFRSTIDATLDARLVQDAYQRQPIYAPALGLAENVFHRLNDPASLVRKTAPFGCCWKSRGKGCPKYYASPVHVCYTM